MSKKVKIETDALDSQVREVLENAKGKLKSLNGDIDQLNNENNELNHMIDTAEQQKKDLKEKNKSLMDELRHVRTQNEHLAKKKQELADELKMAKEELAGFIDRSEQEKIAINKEIKNLKEAERQLNEAKTKERKAFEETRLNNQHKIDILTESLNRKNEEISDLKNALFELNQKEQARMEDLEYEAQNFRKMQEEQE
ncbi:unnamed protein product [Moneuplotes crassus]|uniref:Uncharacterized protein n=1 Tax=Euplotes crassus TaxID=5936 RepID=A0AAD2D4H6_EUPCR|nr:unnamed protein product [Moneuplotes crassus]